MPESGSEPLIPSFPAELAGDAAMPKYQQLAAVLRREILQGSLQAGEKLSSVRELAERYGVNKATIGQTMKQLASEGLLDLREKVGAYVRQRSTGTAAVVFGRNIYDTLRRPYSTMLLAELEQAFHRLGWQCRPFLNTSPWAWQAFHDALRTRQFDVIVCATAQFTPETFDLMKQVAMPAVGVYCIENIDPFVVFDTCELGRRGVDALVAAGAKRIGLIHGPVEFSRDAGPVPGYEAGLKAYGLSVDPSLIRCVPFDEKEGRKALSSLMAEHPDMDGLLVADEVLMQGVERGIIQEGIRVPDDLRIASQISFPQDDPFHIPVIHLCNHVPQQARHLAEVAEALAQGQSLSNSMIRIPPRVQSISEFSQTSDSMAR